MSAGAFSRTKYEADSGDIHPIRIQPETASATLGGSANAAPTDAFTSEQLVRVGGSPRAYGIKARSVTLLTGDTPPTGYKANSYIRIPVLTQAVYDGITLYETATYNGATVTVVGKNRESGKG